MSFLYQQRLDQYAAEGLGLVRDNTVKLTEHNPRWKRVFSNEGYLIQHVVDLDSLYLYHCGSTSIPGICAKPVVDIVGSVDRIEDLDSRQEKLELLGYEYKGEFGIPGRRYCVLYDPDKKRGFVHLHVFERGSKELEDHLLFRDFLRINPVAAEKYESFKRKLSLPRNEYTEAKSDIIQELMNETRGQQPSEEKGVVFLGAAEGHKNTLSFAKESFPDAKIIELREDEIHPYRHGNRGLEDGFMGFIEQAIEADRIVFATPVYWYAMSGVMKDFVDRFSNLLGGPGKALGERLYGKKIELLSTGSDLEIPNGFVVPFNLTATYFGMDFMGFKYKSFSQK